MLSFFPRGVLDEILNLIESVSEDFPSYSCLAFILCAKQKKRMKIAVISRVRIIWLVGYFGLNGPLRQYFSLYRAVSQREGERKEK